MKSLLLFFSLFFWIKSFSQTADMQLFVAQGSNTATSKIGVRIKSTSGTIQYQGVTFYILYQGNNAAYVSTDDSRLVTAFSWGIGNRVINPGQTLALNADGQSFNKRYIYANGDETTGSNIKTLTTAWDTLLYITFNNLQISPVYGGFAYAQKTLEAAGVALTDVSFFNISINTLGGALALNPSVLPITLTKFDAQCQPNKATSVTWTTAQEINNNYFEVERSSDAITWSSLSKVNASGNSSVQKNYQITDALSGAAFYRLKQVDIDGKISYSSIVKTTCEGRGLFVNLYPVPARDVVNLIVGSDKAIKTNLQVFDNKGRLVINKPVSISSGINNFSLPVQRLAAGEYLIRSSDAGIEINKRFTVIR